MRTLVKWDHHLQTFGKEQAVSDYMCFPISAHPKHCSCQLNKLFHVSRQASRTHDVKFFVFILHGLLDKRNNPSSAGFVAIEKCLKPSNF